MARIVHFSNFFVYMEQAEHQFLRHVGLSVHQKTDQRTISWPRVAASCNYIQPIRFEDLIRIEVGIERLGKSSVTYQFNFFREHPPIDQPIADGKLTAVCCAMDTDQGMHSIPIPDTFLQALRPYQLESPYNLLE